MVQNEDDTPITGDTMDTESFVGVSGFGDDAALAVSVLPKHTAIGTEGRISETLICVNIKARDLYGEDDETERAPVDVVVVLDVSGSMMSSAKLELCKNTLEMMIQVLQDGDRFGLVTYHSTAKVEFLPQKMTVENKEKVLQKVRALVPLNSTNLSAGIGLAVHEMLAIEKPNEVRSIFLLTDGLPNIGICDPTGLVELTRNCLGGSPLPDPESETDGFPCEGSVFQGIRRLCDPENETKIKGKSVALLATTFSAPPITVHCFGYGLNHNAKLLREIASATDGGTYYFVKEDCNVAVAFGDALGGILSVVAQNTVITARVPADAEAMGVVITKVYHDQSIQRKKRDLHRQCG